MSIMPIPPEEINIDYQKIFWSSKRIARMAIFIALSAVGAMIKVPSPTGTVALDAAFAFFSAITFGWREGAIVAALGHMLTALTTGFPLSLPIHLFIAVQMSIWVSAFELVAKKVHLWVGAIVAVFLNGPISSFLVMPIGGFGLTAALIIPLTIAASINIFIAITAYLIISKSKMVENMITDLLLEKYKALKKQNNSEAFKTRSVRDILVTELTENFWMITTCDSDGGIGSKKYDTIFSPAYDLGRLAARVPIMEMLASGALPVVVVDTLCVEMDPTGKEIIKGIRDEVSEAGLNGDLVVTGSTEDNVNTDQTGVGVVVVGFVEKNDFRPGRSLEGDLVACLGIPKSAPEYKVHYADNEIANTKLIKQLNAFEFIHDILPVGSKGIAHEIRELAKSACLSPFCYEGINLDVTKSGGPSTCCIISLPKNRLNLLKDKIDKPITVIGELRKH